jgi:hypothetical protein
MAAFRSKIENYIVEMLKSLTPNVRKQISYIYIDMRLNEHHIHVLEIHLGLHT